MAAEGITVGPDYVRELSLFEHAIRWKAYWAGQIRPFVGPRVLDVGAGLGSTARLLCSPPVASWICLEPDPRLASAIRDRGLPGRAEVRQGVLGDLSGEERFDTVLYMDVLEHIREDRAELARAVSHLMPGGHLVVLAPAHQWLFSPFDAAVGHFRRYDRSSLGALRPPGAQLRLLRYLDAVGVLASGANRVIFGSSQPTIRQILAWDRLMVPISRLIDPVCAWRIGKSVLAVWTKEAP